MPFYTGHPKIVFFCEVCGSFVPNLVKINP